LHHLEQIIRVPRCHREPDVARLVDREISEPQAGRLYSSSESATPQLLLPRCDAVICCAM
jgi:hypothetical protein